MLSWTKSKILDLPLMFGWISLTRAISFFGCPMANRAVMQDPFRYSAVYIIATCILIHIGPIHDRNIDISRQLSLGDNLHDVNYLYNFFKRSLIIFYFHYC